MKDKLFGKANKQDELELEESFSMTHFDLKNKVVIDIDPRTGKRESTPLSVEQEKKLAKLKQNEQEKMHRSKEN